MLLLVTPHRLRLLPACPTELNAGSTTLHFFTGTIQMTWDLEQQQCHGKLTAEKETDLTLELPFGETPRHLVLHPGESLCF